MAPAVKIDIQECATAAVIVVALEEAIAGAVAGVDVDTIDLEAELRRGGPDQLPMRPLPIGIPSSLRGTGLS